MSLIGDQQIINLQHTKVYVFSDCALCLGKTHENLQSNTAWEPKIGVVQKFTGIQKLGQHWWWTNGIRVEYFPGFTTLQLSQEVKDLLLRLNETPENFTRKIIFNSMFNDISLGSRDNNVECESNANLVSLCARRFGAGQWSFLGPGSENKWYSISEDSPQSEWDKIVEKMMLEFGESKHPVFRATSPLSRGQLEKERRWKIVDPLFCQPGHDYNCFSHNYFCKSAQSLRSSCRNVWRIWNLSW